MRNKLIILAAIVGLLAASGVAYADTDGNTGQESDTTFNFGYDEENGVFVWGASGSDGLYDCTLENGELQATYTRVDDSHLLVEDLQDDDGTVELEPNEDHEAFEGGVEAVAYPGPEEECAVSGDFVAGPQGQINHGMFMRLLNLMYDGPGRGCLVRHIAQTGLGKDPQLKVPDVDAEAQELEETFEGTLEFETVMTNCNHGPKTLAATEDGNGPPAHAGRPDHGGRPDHAGGNSASAPGRNP